MLRPMDRTLELAAALGIQTHYYDGLGRHRTVEPEVIARLVDAVALGGGLDHRMLPRTILVRGPSDHSVTLAVPEGLPVRWQILSELASIEGQGASPTIRLPDHLPDGVFRLRVAAGSPPHDRVEQTSLIVCTRRAYQGEDRGAPRRMWALAVQLYGVRSRRNWGHGDFSDLLCLIDIAADLGAAGIGLNPLHNRLRDQESPYFPSSRLLIDPLYIDVEAIPEFVGCADETLRQEEERLRNQDLLNYRGVAAAKLRGLTLAYDRFRANASAERQGAFERFRRQHLVERFACFEILRRKFGTPWWEWPEPWRRPNDEALQDLRRTQAIDIGFVEFMQWTAHEQLERCRARARERAMPIGLYLDIAVGVRSDGFDAWHDQDAILVGTTVGAPPDALNTNGQNWNVAAFNPVGLQTRQFEPYRRMLEASMRYAGAIRLDHVLGLQRLYLVPHGLGPSQGAYLRFPFEALLATTALASWEHECIVVGEDLGTVPSHFRETLAHWGIWSYQVMLFERSAGGAFSPPESYRDDAVVLFSTHDLATFAGWMERHDLAVKTALDIDPGETGDQRDRAREALERCLRQRGIEATDFVAVMKYLADTPSRLLVVSMEDALGAREQVNVPGTVDEHPNWRRRLSVDLEDLRQQPLLTRVAEVMTAAGRSCSLSRRA
jgi:4-alpha-glucanotransferase